MFGPPPLVVRTLVQLNMGEQQMTIQIKLKIAALSLLFLIVFTGLGTATVAWCWNSYMNIYRAIDISALSKEPPRSTVFYDGNGALSPN